MGTGGQPSCARAWTFGYVEASRCIVSSEPARDVNSLRAKGRRDNIMGDFTDTKRRAAREKPLDIIALGHPEYDFAPVHNLYAEIVDNATFAPTHPKVKMPRKFVYIGPPRHSKSESI